MLSMDKIKVERPKINPTGSTQADPENAHRRRPNPKYFSKIVSTARAVDFFENICPQTKLKLSRFISIKDPPAMQLIADGCPLVKSRAVEMIIE